MSENGQPYVSMKTCILSSNLRSDYCLFKYKVNRHFILQVAKMLSPQVLYVSSCLVCYFFLLRVLSLPKVNNNARVTLAYTVLCFIDSI